MFIFAVTQPNTHLITNHIYLTLAAYSQLKCASSYWLKSPYVKSRISYVMFNEINFYCFPQQHVLFYFISFNLGYIYAILNSNRSTSPKILTTITVCQSGSQLDHCNYSIEFKDIYIHETVCMQTASNFTKTIQMSETCVLAMPLKNQAEQG